MTTLVTLLASPTTAYARMDCLPTPPNIHRPFRILSAHNITRTANRLVVPTVAARLHACKIICVVLRAQQESIQAQSQLCHLHRLLKGLQRPPLRMVLFTLGLVVHPLLPQLLPQPETPSQEALVHPGSSSTLARCTGSALLLQVYSSALALCFRLDAAYASHDSNIIA